METFVLGVLPLFMNIFTTSIFVPSRRHIPGRARVPSDEGNVTEIRAQLSLAVVRFTDDLGTPNLRAFLFTDLDLKQPGTSRQQLSCAETSEPLENRSLQKHTKKSSTFSLFTVYRLLDPKKMRAFRTPPVPPRLQKFHT